MDARDGRGRYLLWRSAPQSAALRASKDFAENTAESSSASSSWKKEGYPLDHGEQTVLKTSPNNAPVRGLVEAPRKEIQGGRRRHPNFLVMSRHSGGADGRAELSWRRHAGEAHQRNLCRRHGSLLTGFGTDRRPRGSWGTAPKHVQGHPSRRPVEGSTRVLASRSAVRAVPDRITR